MGPAGRGPWSRLQHCDPWFLGGDEAVRHACKIALAAFYEKEKTVPNLLFKTVRSTFPDLLSFVHGISQVLQDIAEDWRNPFGSIAREVLDSFFDTTDEYRRSDEARQAFAKDQLESYKFLYGETVTFQNQVLPFLFCFVGLKLKCLAASEACFLGVLGPQDICSSSQRYQGFPMGCRFCAHLQDKQAAQCPLPVLCRCKFFSGPFEDVSSIHVLFQVQRALTLWSSGIVTIHDAAYVSTGGHGYSFSRDNWKVATDWYMEQVTNLKEQELNDIMDQAQKYTWKVGQNLLVLVRPPEQRRDSNIPEGLRSDSPPPTPPVTGSAAPIRTKEVRFHPYPTGGLRSKAVPRSHSKQGLTSATSGRAAVCCLLNSSLSR